MTICRDTINSDHACFQVLDDIAEFYECISETSYSFIQKGTKGLINYESYVFLAIRGTVDSIKVLLQKGRVNDAIVLVRKFYDDILTQIYMMVILKEKFDVFNNFFVEEVNQWLESSFRIPKVLKILQKLENSPYTKDLYPFFGWESDLARYRQLLDDSVHANTYRSMLLNCNVVYQPGVREKQLDEILLILKQLMRVQVAFNFQLSPEYMMSSDYVDYLDKGRTPPKGSEHWIAPFAQEAFNNFVKPDAILASFIRSNCPLNIS